MTSFGVSAGRHFYLKETKFKNFRLYYICGLIFIKNEKKKYTFPISDDCTNWFFPKQFVVERLFFL